MLKGLGFRMWDLAGERGRCRALGSEAPQQRRGRQLAQAGSQRASPKAASTMGLPESRAETLHGRSLAIRCPLARSLQIFSRCRFAIRYTRGARHYANVLL